MIMPRLRTPAARPAVALAALLVSLLAGCSSGRITAPDAPAVPDDQVVASFAGETLTLGEFERRYARSVGSREAAAQDSFPAYADFLSRYVDFRLKVQQARDLGLDEDSTLQQEIDDYRAQLAKPYFLEREVLDDIISDLYEKRREEINAAHILIQVPETAAPADTLAAFKKLAAIRDSIVAGADFETLAVRHSEDPSAQQNRGDLGYFTAGRMIFPFEQQAYGNAVGDISPVFRTRFGYHILKVKDRRPASPKIQASHILLRLGSNATAADSTQAYELAQSLRQRVLAGEDFATLARQYSDDTASGQQGGDLGFFERTRMVAPFADAAYALEEIGDVSDIVETRFGYHIIQLTGREELPTYDEAYPELKRLAERLPRTTIRRQAVGQELRQEMTGTIDSALVRRATASYHPDTLLRNAVIGRFGEFADDTFATLDDSTYTLGALADYVRGTRVRPASDQLAQLFDLADDFLNEQAVELAAFQLEDRDPEFRRIMEDYADGVLLFRISEDSVWNAATRDSLALLRHYESHQDEYRFPERHRVIGFYSRNDSLLQVVASALDAGRTPAEIDALVADAEQDVSIDTVYVSEATDSLFDAALPLNVGQRTAILPYQSRKAILLLDAVEAPRTKTFDEARAQVVTDYQDVLDERLRSRLRQKYDAELYPQRLQAAFDGASSVSASAGDPQDAEMAP
jgi:peptidyl-prolyl cis-trans isomerase SurA